MAMANIGIESNNVADEVTELRSDTQQMAK
jgi:hypothetical protein